MNISANKNLEAIVIIDTDVGYDDTMVIAMLLAAKIPIIGITIVHGVAHVEQGANNVLRLLERTGHVNIPISIGADQPLNCNHAFETDWRNKQGKRILSIRTIESQ
ncbi:hypothetical protein FJR38_26405 [Anabaena sp. UHCC 0253]|uniref:nucleoside hydrolase n=1 Tax=Anabaena sp. UHCC 0253 TaxID=2590019 RepID=UPI001445E4F6|nr:nucleoside hydrolase [Anabaena sp. UHCC 0253]MTJ55938.1 hypothetical protein [Anabaena sp. UHCC 0253]